MPPSTIKGGETVTLKLDLSFTKLELSFYGGSGYANADFDEWDVPPGGVTAGAIRFKNKDEKDGFAIDTYPTANVNFIKETVTAKAPTDREEGDKIALRTMFSGHSQGTCYIYVWKQVNGSAPPLDTEGLEGIVDIS